MPRRASRLRVMLRAMTAASEADRLQEWFAPFTLYERQSLTEVEGRDYHRQIWAETKGDLVQRMLYFDCRHWLVNNLLERGDRMAMAASVESRPPLLDHCPLRTCFQPTVQSEGPARKREVDPQESCGAIPPAADRPPAEGWLQGSS